jgi:hypothetical protein
MTAALPAWPFAILAALVALGYRQSLDRVVKPGTLVRVALVMLVLSLYGIVSAFGAQLLPVLGWAIGFGAALTAGAPLFTPRGLQRVADGVRVPGSWLPMAMMGGIFAAKFALGFAAGTHAPVLQAPWFIALVSAALGLFSGAFAARAVAVHRCARAG